MRANSQFPQPDLHRQDTGPYGLRTEPTDPSPPLNVLGFPTPPTVIRPGSGLWVHETRNEGLGEDKNK